ncbi:hypothetical protein BCR43DRAFT_544810, partial [Syncephalastrum racemosum]
NRDKVGTSLLKVSSAYEAASQGKIAFDHSKAMFGLLSILKAIACRYQHGSFELFRQIKVHFIHAYGNAVRHCSMISPEPGVYIIQKSKDAEISALIGDNMPANLSLVFVAV